VNVLEASGVKTPEGGGFFMSYLKVRPTMPIAREEMRKYVGVSLGLLALFSSYRAVSNKTQ
jgi:hypothetical protein